MRHALPIGLVLALAAAGRAGERPPLRLETGDLAVATEIEGRVDAPRRAKLRVVTDAYGGPLRVAEVARESGPVERGETILRFDAARLDEELRAAREGRDEARRRLEQLRDDLRILQAQHRTRLERAERGKEQAERALALFERHEGLKMLREAELHVRGREQAVLGQREELAQLEKMYEGTTLASETKEIVIERARRALELAEAWLELAKKDRAVTVEEHYPRRLERLRDELRWATEELEQAREGARLAEARKQSELELAAIALRTAEERAQKLEADRERLTVRAPLDGVLAAHGLAAGDAVSSGQAFGEIVPRGDLVVRLQAWPSDIEHFLAAPRARLEVSFPELPLVRLGARVAEIGLLGAETKEGTRFPATLTLEAPPPAVRVGLRAIVRAESVLAGVASIPRACVVRKDGKTFCAVRATSGEIALREVVLGPGNEERVQLIAGLGRGEEELALPPAGPPPAAEPAEGEKKKETAPPAGSEGVSAPAAPGAAAVFLEARAPRAGSAPALPAPSPAAAYERGLAFLIRTQNRDGSWGTFETSRTGEIYLGTVASHHAFREATTALCALALLGPSREQAAARAALDRALDHLLLAPPAARATGDTFYDTWTHTYLVEALARVAADPRFLARREAIAPVLGREIAILCERRGADGGWGYYDFGYARRTPSGNMSTSFNTSAALLALLAAREAGFDVPEAAIRDGLACLERLRLPSGAYAYGTYARLRPGALYNRVKGSLGRSQPCNLALFKLGRGISRAELAAGLAAMREHHHFLEIGKNRPYPHEAWYYTSGYYFLFGHWYAARVGAELEAGERAEHASWLASVLARLQDPDGSWFDYPLYGYHKPYGTAYALLALELALAR